MAGWFSTYFLFCWILFFIYQVFCTISEPLEELKFKNLETLFTISADADKNPLDIRENEMTKSKDNLLCTDSECIEGATKRRRKCFLQINFFNQRLSPGSKL